MNRNVVFIDLSLPRKSDIRLVSRFGQLGGMMIESLIGLLLLGIIGGGIMHTSARMANAQQELAIGNIAVNQLRSMLQSRASATGGDLCVGAHKITLPGGSNQIDMTVYGCNKVDMKINGVTIAGSALGEQKINSVQPLVLEMGKESDKNLVRVGGVADAIR